MRYILLIICLFIMIGCYSRVEFTPYKNAIYTPRTDWHLVDTFTASPSKPFIELGYLQSYNDSRIRFPFENLLILKKEAANVGADAIINLSCTPDGVGWGPSFCQGTAIRFIDK